MFIGGNSSKPDASSTEEKIDKSGDKNENEDDEDALSNQYCETEHNAFDNKMHPTKIVEKNWVDSYKLV